MNPVKFEGCNKTYVAPDSMKDSCRDLHVQIGEGRVVSCWEFTDDELAEINQTKRIYICVNGEVQPPMFPATYNPLTDILSVSEDMKGSHHYLILTKLWKGNHGVIEYFSYLELPEEIFHEPDEVRGDMYSKAYYELCAAVEEKMNDKLYQKDIVVRLAMDVKELTPDDIIPLILSTQLTSVIKVGAMREKGTNLTKANIRQALDLPQTFFYIIAEAQGFHKAYAWQMCSEQFMNSKVNDDRFKNLERVLVAELEKKKGRSLSFEPVTFYVARQRDVNSKAPQTIEELRSRCDIVLLGERIQF